MPAVSIIVPLHNKGLYVAETIRSVQAQYLTDWELIVVENGSTDNGPDLVEAIAKSNLRIRLVVAPREVKGPCAARNLGLSHATAEWLLFLDADDMIEPDHLSKLYELGQTSSADIVAGGWKEFIEGGAVDSHEREGPGMRDTSYSVLDRSLGCAPWAVHAALIRREWLGPERYWPMEMEGHPSEDSVFWFRALQEARLAVSPSKGAIYRKETVGHRDCHSDTERWARAVLEVIRLNENWLVREGRWPSQAQAACVVRTLEALHMQCQRAQAHEMSARVIREAKRWLSRTSLREPGPLLRRILGIKGFGVLRQCLK